MTEAPGQTKPQAVLVRVLIEHKFLLLFLFLLATLVAYPYAEHKGFGYYAFRVLTGAIIALSVLAVSVHRSLAVVAILLAIPAAMAHFRRPDASPGFWPLLNLVLSLGFDVWVLVAIFRRVFANVRITSETILGALCIYLLNGLSFANVYDLLAKLQPGAFVMSPEMNNHTVLDRFDFIYYSFGMMTQLGAAGITAVSDQARSLSLLEAILGQLYLAVLISRLVGAHRSGRSMGDS
jgi:Ion channel